MLRRLLGVEVDWELSEFIVLFTFHIEIKSQEERHTINRAELSAIALALDLHKEAPNI